MNPSSARSASSAAAPKRPAGPGISGWLILDKPLEITSAHAVARARRLTGQKKIGHAGTLDPLATGVLPLALGEATKTMQYVVDAEKEYRFRIVWGAETDSGDTEGIITHRSDVRPDPAAVAAILGQFTGDILLRPPAFSAIKVDGQRAYDLARNGEMVDLPPRVTRIDSLHLVQADAEGATLEVVCGKGTYIRALAPALALALGTVGHVGSLRRTRVGRFTEHEAFSLETLAEMAIDGGIMQALMPLSRALDGIPAGEIAASDAARLRHGQPIPVAAVLRDLPDDTLPPPVWKRGDVVLVSHRRTPVALCTVQGLSLQPTRVFA